MSDTVKRLRYFNQQFLTEKDFTDEQDYHLQRRRQHNQFLHTPGIGTGLEVEKTDAKTITVHPGTAIDIRGQEIVQDKAFPPIDLSDEHVFPRQSTVYVTIQYTEVVSEEDRQVPDKPGTETRFLEKPLIKASINAPATDGTIIQLAKFQLDENGNVQGQVGDKLDGGVRKSVGSVLADRSVSANKLKTELVKEADIELDGTSASGSSKQVEAYTTTLDKPNSAFILVYAYARNVPQGQEAHFNWIQEYITSSTGIRQVVTFKTESNFKFQVHYRIYSVLES